MTEETSFQPRQDGLQTEKAKPAFARPSGFGSKPADAGVVLRRSPDPNAPGSWRVAPLRRPPSNVDTEDRQAGRPTFTNVDTEEKGNGHRPSSNVDTAPAQGSRPSSFAPPPKRAFATPSSSNVDTEDDYQLAPMPMKSSNVVPTKLRDFDKSRTSGPSGPNSDVVRRLREATKQLVVDRAKARGRDPSAGSVEVKNGMTRSEKTQEQYLERGRSLVKRFQREAGLSQGSLLDLDPLEFSKWFLSLKPNVKPSTWRPYRQSAKAILSAIPHDNTEAAMALIDADIVEIEMTDQPMPKSELISNFEGDRKKLPRRTSARKEKRFPKGDFDRVISFARHFSGSKLAPILIDWMTAGIATGLRPIEWATTDIEIREDPSAPKGHRIWLYVLNAKSTNGRANGLARTIDISNFSDETLRAIRHMSENGGDWLSNGRYATYQSQVAQLLYSISQKLFVGRSKIYSLYSLRHQFIANAKSYQTPEEIAAIVGHGVTSTASENYGKKRSSWGPDEITERPNAVAEEIATVKQSLEFYENRMKLKEAAGLLQPNRRSKSEK